MKLLTFALFLATLSFSLAYGQAKKDVDDQVEPIIVDPVEHSATFPGGVDSLRRFIKKNLVRPPANFKNGRVYVQFVVNKDGTTSDFTVVRGLTEECNDSALDVLRKMPK